MSSPAFAAQTRQVYIALVTIKLVKSWTKGGQKLDKRWTKMGQFRGIFGKNRR